MVGQNFRFNSDTQTAKQIVDRGAVGDIYHAKTSWQRRAGIPRIGSWFTQRRYAGGGCTYDIGVHALDRCLYLMGEFEAASVSGHSSRSSAPAASATAAGGGRDRSQGALRRGRPFGGAHQVEERKDGPPQGLVGRPRAALDVNDTQLFGTEGGLSLPPVKLFKQTKGGYLTEAVDLLPPLVNTNRCR